MLRKSGCHSDSDAQRPIAHDPFLHRANEIQGEQDETDTLRRDGLNLGELRMHTSRGEGLLLLLLMCGPLPGSDQKDQRFLGLHPSTRLIVPARIDQGRGLSKVTSIGRLFALRCCKQHLHLWMTQSNPTQFQVDPLRIC